MNHLFHVTRGDLSVSFFVSDKGPYAFSGSKVLAAKLLVAMSMAHNLDGHSVPLEKLTAADVWFILEPLKVSLKSTYVPQERTLAQDIQT